MSRITIEDKGKFGERDPDKDVVLVNVNNIDFSKSLSIRMAKKVHDTFL